METTDNVLYLRVVESENTMDMPTKELAERYYYLLEDLLEQYPTKAAAMREIHVAIKHAGYSRSRTAIEGYHRVVQWIVEQRGAIEWVEDRTYTQHLWAIAKRNQFSWDELVKKEPMPTGTAGNFHESKGVSLETRALDLRTRANHMVKHIEMEAGFARGHRKRLLNDALSPIAEAEAILNETVLTLVR